MVHDERNGPARDGLAGEGVSVDRAPPDAEEQGAGSHVVRAIPDAGHRKTGAAADLRIGKVDDEIGERAGRRWGHGP
jgi:hypothetical protein